MKEEFLDTRVKQEFIIVLKNATAFYAGKNLKKSCDEAEYYEAIASISHKFLFCFALHFGKYWHLPPTQILKFAEEVIEAEKLEISSRDNIKSDSADLKTIDDLIDAYNKKTIDLVKIVNYELDSNFNSFIEISKTLKNYIKIFFTLFDGFVFGFEAKSDEASIYLLTLHAQNVFNIQDDMRLNKFSDWFEAHKLIKETDLLPERAIPKIVDQFKVKLTIIVGLFLKILNHKN
jgi:hypothetical protein